MKTWVALMVAVSVASGGCRGGSTKTKRTGNAAPVEMITQAQLPGGGAGTGVLADEIEPNDGEDVATPVALGGTGRGKIEPETDADYYRLDIDKSGVLQVSLAGIEGVDLSLELLDGTGTSLGKSDRPGARVKEGIPNAGVTPGRYTLVVRQVPKKKPKAVKSKKGAAAATEAEAAPAGSAPTYELTAQLVPIPVGGEREPDDDRGTANDLIVTDNAVGFVGWSGDKDVWKLSVETLSEKNALDIQVSAIEGIALELEVTDGVGTVLASRKAPRGQALWLENMLPVVPEGAPPFYYLTVRADRSNPETAYTLHATAAPLGPDPELEPNDNADKPQMIAADRTTVHASWTPGDVDCFTLAPANTARTVDFEIDTPSEIDLQGELLVDGKSVASANKGGKGVLEKVSALVPAGAKVVLRVKDPDAAATATAKYDVRVQESGATGDNAP